MNGKKMWKQTAVRCMAAICAFIVLSMLMPAEAFAADSTARTVRIGYYENEVFQEGAAEDAVKTGYAYEYYQKLSEYTGWQYEYVYGEFGDLYQKLLDGEIDLLAGLAWKEEREKLIGYPDAPMGNESYNLVRHNTDEDITADPASLNGKKIGVLESAMADVLRDFLQSHDTEAEIVLFRDYEPLFTAFDDHDIDVLAAEGDGAYGRKNAELLYAFGTSDYYLCVCRQRPDLLEELNTAQSQLSLEEPDYLHFLHSKYYPFSISSRGFSAMEKEWLAEHKELRVGYLNHYLPYSDTAADGEVTGLIRDIVPRMMEGLGISDVEITFTGYTSYDEMTQALGAGEIDTAFPVGGGMYYSEKGGIFQSTPVVSAVTELVHKGEYTDETTAHFAVNENNRMQYYFVRTYYPDAEITFYPSIDDCLKAVNEGKAGCTTLNGLRANDILRNSRHKGLSMLQTTHDDDRCFGVQIGNAGLLKLLNRGISVLGSDYAQNLAFRYTDQLYSYSAGDMIRNNLPLFAAIILGVAALIIFLLARDRDRSRRELKERRALQEELVEALHAAEQANRAKTAFLSNMSHEIRTPMNAIIGLDSLALRNDALPGETREYLEKIDGSARHLLGLINDILDMSRIESGRLVLRKEEFSFSNMLEQINTIVMSQCAEKGLHYECRVIGGVSDYYIGDDMKLKQVLINILSNAIKFTEAPGQVAMTVERTAVYDGHSTLKFCIKDTGIGMDAEFIPKIFDAFTQEDSSRNNKYGSTGLGMAITKNIVELMNGSISVESEKGAGTEFTVIISLTDSEHQGADVSYVNPKDLRVLVVDDEEIDAEHARIVLDEAGIQADTCLSGQEALSMLEVQHIKQEPYNLVLLDWKMPEMDGIEVAGEIRRRYDKETTVIILTAFNWDDIMDEALHAGVDSFLAKPLFALNVVDEFERIARKNNMNLSREKKRVPLKGRHILMAEDIVINAEIMKQIIQMREAAIDHAENGRIAVDMFAASEPGYYDAILMDVRMPEMDGLEATAAIRALDRPDAKTIPIIALTANAFDEDVQQSLQVGMNAHLSKPVEPEHLYRTLEELIGEKEKAE